MKPRLIWYPKWQVWQVQSFWIATWASRLCAELNHLNR